MEKVQQFENTLKFVTKILDDLADAQRNDTFVDSIHSIEDGLGGVIIEYYEKLLDEYDLYKSEL